MVKQVYLLTGPAVRAFRPCPTAVYSIYCTYAHFVPWGAWTSPPYIEAQFIVSDRVDKVDYRTGLSYLPVRLYIGWRADNLIPLSTLSPIRDYAFGYRFFYPLKSLSPFACLFFPFASIMLGLSVILLILSNPITNRIMLSFF